MPNVAANVARTSTDGPPVLTAATANRLFILIGDSELVENGQALLVSIAAVRDALGARWESRRDQVYEVAERQLEKHLAPTDICQRASDVHFLVATPDKSPKLAQAICYRAASEVLAYFLGEVKPADIQVSQVAGLSDTGAEVRPFTVAELRLAEAEARPATPTKFTAPSLEQVAPSGWPLVTADGQDLRVSFAVDPVMDLKAWAMAGHRIESRIVNRQSGVELTSAQRRILLPRDFETIDLAALDRGLSRLAALGVVDRPKLTIQLSFASLSNGRARAALLARARQHQEVLKRAAICELIDVENGVPVGRLTEVASLVQGFFRTLWIQVEPSRDLIDTAGAVKASGLTIRAADLGDDPQSIAEGMRAFAPMLKRRSVILTVTSLPTTDLLIDAMAAGFSHATLRAKPAPAVGADGSSPGVFVDEARDPRDPRSDVPTLS